MSSQPRWGNTHTDCSTGRIYPQRMGQWEPGDGKTQCTGVGKAGRLAREVSLFQFSQVPPGKRNGLINWNTVHSAT